MTTSSDSKEDAPAHLTATLLHTFRGQRTLAERALAQVPDGDFTRVLPGEIAPLAITVKHVGGNLRSRWREFLTTDGEKPDRHRDTEFELAAGDDRASIEALWNAGWGELMKTLEMLDPTDWDRTITIRGETHSVAEASLRSLAHTSYHVGQIVQMSRRIAGDTWQGLSIPRGQSEAFRQNPAPNLKP
ncbi:MAG: hypothetical protein ACI8QS_001311 [Planctomycetota bacterium]